MTAPAGYGIFTSHSKKLITPFRRICRETYQRLPTATMAYAKGETGNGKGQVRPKPVRDALYALLSRPGDDPLDDKPKTMAQRLAMSLMIDAVFSNDPDIRAEARSEIIDRTDGKAIQAIEHSGSIARTHEEELLALDNPESNDATGEEATSQVS